MAFALKYMNVLRRKLRKKCGCDKVHNVEELICDLCFLQIYSPGGEVQILDIFPHAVIPL